MSKKDEREKLAEVVASDNFEEECEEMGFTVCSNAKEGTGKKKANL